MDNSALIAIFIILFVLLLYVYTGPIGVLLFVIVFGAMILSGY
jgi:hypothetical protein